MLCQWQWPWKFGFFLFQTTGISSIAGKFERASNFPSSSQNAPQKGLNVAGWSMNQAMGHQVRIVEVNQ
jgi:hypothetical protein